MKFENHALTDSIVPAQQVVMLSANLAMLVLAFGSLIIHVSSLMESKRIVGVTQARVRGRIGLQDGTSATDHPADMRRIGGSFE